MKTKMNSLQQLSSLLSKEDLDLLKKQAENTYELIGVHEMLKVSSSYKNGYAITSDYEVYLKKDSSFFLVTLKNWYGDCVSGFTSATAGIYTMPEIIPPERLKQFHYVPSDSKPLKVLVETFEVADYEHNTNFHISDWATGEVLLYCLSEGDPYYPSGEAGFHKNSENYFNKTNRHIGKIKVFLVEGRPTVGKTTLFPEGLELEQFNAQELTVNYLIPHPVLICGGEWTFDKIVSLLKTDDFYFSNIEIVRVTLQ